MTQRTKPPFRADHVGSFLRPAALKVARERRAKEQITTAALREIEDREIEAIVKKQEASPTANFAAPGGISIFSGVSTASNAT